MFTVHPFVGFEFVLVMFVVVVLGGMGSVVGAVLAGLLIGVLEVFTDFVIGPDSKQAVYFLLFIAVLVLKPSGLFGLKGEEEIERIEAIE
jgi:branched-chain amino acid transport system permease protein